MNKIYKINCAIHLSKKVKDAGHIESYNRWLLTKRDPEGFKQRRSTNKEKWDSFVQWFGSNGLKFDESNKF